MGKYPIYVESDETEDTCSSVENVKKKKFSILKYTGGSVKKKKCKAHSTSDPEDSEYRARVGSGHAVQGRKLRGILKHDRERESSDEDEDLDEPSVPKPRDKYLVGRVPRPAGSRPGRGGGVAIVIRKNTPAPQQSLQAQGSASSNKRRHLMKRLTRKRSY